jgi:hypothetical protein
MRIIREREALEWRLPLGVRDARRSSMGAKSSMPFSGP